MPNTILGVNSVVLIVTLLSSFLSVQVHSFLAAHQDSPFCRNVKWYPHQKPTEWVSSRVHHVVSRSSQPHYLPRNKKPLFDSITMNLMSGPSLSTTTTTTTALSAATTGGWIDRIPSSVRPDHVLTALEGLYPTSGLDQRIALSRKDGYWPFIQKGEDPPQEFVYGEFDIGFFAQVLDHAAMYYPNDKSSPGDGTSSVDGSSSSPWKDKVFCDLGSGTGRLVLAAAALHPWKLCRGIELLDGIHQEATGILKRCCGSSSTEGLMQQQQQQQSNTTPTFFSTDSAALSGPAGNDGSSSSSSALSIPLAPIELKCGSFDDPYEFYGDANLIFVFSSCMNPPILIKLARSIGRQCQPGCLVLTTEYTLPIGEGVSYIDPLPDDPNYPSGPYSFELLESITGPNLATGGESTVHIHRVTQALGTGSPHPKPTLSVSEMAYRAVMYAEDPTTNNVDAFLRRLVNQMAFIGLPESWWNIKNDPEQRRRDVPLRIRNKVTSI